MALAASCVEVVPGGGGADPEVASGVHVVDTGGGATGYADPTGRGVDATVTVTPYEACPEDAPSGPGWTPTWLPVGFDEHAFVAGGGVGVGDLDGDGDLDLVANSRRRVVRFLQVERGRFDAGVELARQTIDRYRPGWFGPAVVDVDGDGDLDVHVTGYDVPGLLLLNEGDGTFTDAASSLGLVLPWGFDAGSSSWADMDADGDLDVAVAGLGEIDVLSSGHVFPVPWGGWRTRLFEQHDGRFVDVSDRLDDRLHGGFAFNAAWLALDDVAGPDLMLVYDFGEERFPSQAVLQHDGRFELAPDDLGLSVFTTGMGLGVADASGDGVPDLLLPGWGRLSWLQSVDGRWFDAAAATGLVPPEPDAQVIAWGAAHGDLDNDADEDVLVGFGDLSLPARLLRPATSVLPEQRDAVWLTTRRGLVDAGAALGLDDPANTRGVLLVDLDADGWLDVVRHAPEAGVRLDLSGCRANPRSVAVALHDPTGANPFGVGARITAVVGGVRHTRWIHAGGVSYAAGPPPEVHVGLGDARAVDAFEVRWPDGTETVHGGAPVGHRVHLTRP